MRMFSKQPVPVYVFNFCIKSECMRLGRRTLSRSCPRVSCVELEDGHGPASNPASAVRALCGCGVLSRPSGCPLRGGLHWVVKRSK